MPSGWGCRCWTSRSRRTEIAVSVVRRSGVQDAGVDWFLERVREAVGA